MSLWNILGTQTNDNQTVSSTGDFSDVQVVEEKLTYVNQHAKLASNVTDKAFSFVEKIIKEKSCEVAVRTAYEKVITHYSTLNKDSLNNISNWNKSELLPKHDTRLDSFVNYLLRNDETKNMALAELAVLEQFSYSGLEYNNKSIRWVYALLSVFDQIKLLNFFLLYSSFRNAAEQILTSRRIKYPQDAESLRLWHQAYHFFRRSVHCLVEGLDIMENKKYHEALDLFTESYNFTIKANEIPVSVSSYLAFSFSHSFLLIFLLQILGQRKDH